MQHPRRWRRLCTIVVFAVDRELWGGETDSRALENKAFLTTAEFSRLLLALAAAPVHVSGPGLAPTADPPRASTRPSRVLRSELRRTSPRAFQSQ